MTDFASLADFAAHLAGITVHIEQAQHEGMERAAVVVETEAKRVLGTHDYGWTPLQPATIARKAAGDTPLLETGEMRDSIEHSVGREPWRGSFEAHVGSNNDKAVWHELGTSKIPPRPFLMGAAIHKEEEVRHILGEACILGIRKA